MLEGLHCLRCVHTAASTLRKDFGCITRTVQSYLPRLHRPFSCVQQQELPQLMTRQMLHPRNMAYVLYLQFLHVDPPCMYGCSLGLSLGGAGLHQEGKPQRPRGKSAWRLRYP